MAVLIVENDEDLNYCITLVVQLKGYETIQAYSISEALEILKSKRPTTIIADYCFAGESADDLFKLTRQWYPFDTPRLILITGLESPDIIAKRVKADYLVQKPFNVDNLEPLIV